MIGLCMDAPQGQGGLDRRQLLRRGAIVGGTLVWAAPTVQAFAKPAFAQTGSPPPDSTGKDLSYVVVCYRRDGSTERCCVKFDLKDDGTVDQCEGEKFSVPQCGDRIDVSCGDCNLFRVSSPDGGSTVVVEFKAGADGTFIEGDGLGKCGNPTNPKSGGECVSGTLSANKRKITFAFCGTGST